MNPPISTFIDFSLRSLLQSVPDAWGKSAQLGFLDAEDLIRSDVEICCPHILESSNFEEALVRQMEMRAALTAGILYRIERALFLRNPDDPALAPLAHLMRVRTGMELYYSTSIGPRFRIEHGMGVVIGPRHQIGSDFTIHQGVTLGQRRLGCPGEFITIGDRVALFAGASLLGSICIGDDARIAANAVLLTDAEPGSTYAGVPAKRVH